MDLQLQPGSAERLAGQLRGEDRLLGRTHPRGIRQNEMLLGIESGKNAVVLGTEAHALHGYRDHFGPRGIENRAQGGGGRILTRAREEAGSERAIGDAEEG